MNANYINFYIFLIAILVIIGFILLKTNNNYCKNIEGLTDLSDLSVSFCNHYSTDTSKLQDACVGLTSDTCKNVNCCVYANDRKCLAGSANGPTYKTDFSGKKNVLDNYYNMNSYYDTQ